MVIHLPATLFLILAAREFALLSDIELLQTVNKYGPTGFANHLHGSKDTTIGDRFQFLFLMLWLSGLGAIVFSFLISLFTSIKNRIFWLNSFLLLIISFIMNGDRIITSRFIKYIPFTVGWLFHTLEIQYQCVFTGIALASISFFIFFHPGLKRFILKQSGPDATEAQRHG